ncbi:MAG: DegQ family serine endoprotease [Acidobacteriota bacterium]
MKFQIFWKESRIFAFCLVSAAVGAVVGSGIWAAHAPELAPVAAASTAAITPGSVDTSFAPVVERALPAVVNISSSKATKVSAQDMPPMDPFRQFFGEEFGGRGRGSSRGSVMPRKQYEHSLGSGVVVRSDGYILTNNHVIDGADDITVTFDNKHEMKAKLVGTDAKTDVAVLKVDASNLPTIALADSSQARVGDIVLAMGSPFGLKQTVTMGIVSARGRTGLGIEAYEDFIQTDASINPGNSGGPLINTHGELIGINTAILANNGGNQGVGFAIPANLARSVMTQVMEHGKVVRGYLGLLPQDITPAMAQALHYKETQGVLVGDVTAGAPAAEAGLKRGDVILDLDGKKVDDSNQLRMRVSMTAPGTTVQLRVIHDGAERTVPVKLAEMPGNLGASAEKGSESGATSALDGVTVEAAQGHGVTVTSVDEGSPAAEAGLREGDTILEVNRASVSSTADFNRAMHNVSNGATLLLVKRGDNTFYIALQAK